MRFVIDFSTSQNSNGVLVYRPAEYSFDVEPAHVRSFTSILIDDLNVEVDDLGRVVSVWGVCPHTRWIEAKLTPPESNYGTIFFVSDTQLMRGVSIQLKHNGHLPVHVDSGSGWVRIQAEGIPAASVKLLSGVIFELTGEGQFCSLWLLPRKLSNSI